MRPHKISTDRPDLLTSPDVMYLLTDNVQLDALVARGITSESPKYLFTVGVSARS